MYYVYQNDIPEPYSDVEPGSAGLLEEADTLEEAKNSACESGFNSLTIVQDDSDYVYNSIDGGETWKRER